jgi:hypothetical protein
VRPILFVENYAIGARAKGAIAHNSILLSTQQYSAPGGVPISERKTLNHLMGRGVVPGTSLNEKVGKVTDNG